MRNDHGHDSAKPFEGGSHASPVKEWLGLMPVPLFAGRWRVPLVLELSTRSEPSLLASGQPVPWLIAARMVTCPVQRLDVQRW